MGRISAPVKVSRLPALDDAWMALEKRGWLSGRSAEVSETLKSIARIRCFEAGTHLYFAGDKADGVYGLLSGALDVKFPRADGEEITLHRADPGFWIGDLALLSNEFRLVTVRVAEDSVCVHLPQSALGRLLDIKPEIYADFYVMSHSNVATMLQIIGSLSISPSRARVALRLLLQASQLPNNEEWIHLSQDKFSELLGLSIPTLQRTLRELEREGLIELGYGRLRLMNPDGLMKLSGGDARQSNSIK